MLTVHEIAAELGVTPATIKKWQRRGHIMGRRIDGRRECLYEPGQGRPVLGRWTGWADESVTPIRDDEPNRPTERIGPASSTGGAV
jgi:hypothetical protein